MTAAPTPVAALEAIAGQFKIPGPPRQIRPWGSGHINDTYRCETAAGALFILQRLNHRVFKNPEALMENVVRVTTHICARAASRPTTHIDSTVLRVIPARGGAPFHRDAAGDYWRVFPFISGAHTCDVVQSTAQAFEAGRAFGHFLRQLADLPGPPLHETIPGFHDGRKRIAAFRCALATDRAGRAVGVYPETTAILSRASVFDVLPDAVARGAIPMRTTHNDTKINNVLLDDATGEGLCVIDLDTVMPGLVAYDFGDLMRTAASPAHEDEPDLARVTIDLPRFEALARGYLEACGDILTLAERAHLVFGGKMMTFIMAVRFLTDYLEGDVYYKTARPGHNLDRARAQLRLVMEIEAQEAPLSDWIARL